MAEPAGPMLLTFLTGGLSGGGLWTADADHVATAPVWALRGGLTFRSARMDLELVLGNSSGLLREVPHPYDVAYTHVDALFWLADGVRLDPYVAAGVGWRALDIRPTTIDGQEPEASVRYTVDPVTEALLSAGAGVRLTVWGPVHLRADAHLTGVLGDQPVDEPTHLLPGLDATLGLDLRAEGPPDRDHDHVPDRRDACPLLPEDHDYYEDKDGCPEDDDDRDGVADLIDACKDLAEDHDAFEDDDGCPETNNDRDGFPDSVDACPSEAETPNSWLDGDGCPDTVPDDVQHRLGIRPALQFDGTALLPSAESELVSLIDASRAHPEAVFQLRFHTDGLSGATAAWKHTRDQARAVHAWLAGHGAEMSRFDFKLLGDLAPLARDDTPEGAAQNRRVEVRLYVTLGADGKPMVFTPVPPEEW